MDKTWNDNLHSKHRIIGLWTTYGTGKYSGQSGTWHVQKETIIADTITGVLSN